MKGNLQKLVLASMLAALCCVATMIIKIPSPLKGYINFGDCVVLLSGWILSPGYAFLAAGIGSALADVFAGYVMYVPATFLIKGFMAVTAHRCFLKIYSKLGDKLARIVSGMIAEVIMILGYFVFESCLYGISVSAINIPANAVQGAAGIIVGIQLVKIFKKTALF